MQEVKSKIRNGNVTSSEVVALLSTLSRPMTDDELKSHLIEFPKSIKKNIDSWPGKGAVTYINQCNMERRLGRSLDSEIDAKPTNWGKFVEPLLFSMLEEMYTYNSNETLTHPLFDYWLGTPDGFKKIAKKTVVDAKCPFTLSSFCQLIDPLYDGLEGFDAMMAAREGYTDKMGLFHAPHKDGDKFYWQLVSNACIDDCEAAELIVYCPYESELSVIQHMAVESGNPMAYFIANGSQKSLPYIKDEGFYKNINIISFDIPGNDKDFLTETVKKTGEYLIKV
jgi:hypothetical protein